MITLLGVGHVFDIGDKVREVIHDRRPSIVCVELDDQRYWALTHKTAPSGWEPPLHFLLATFQRKIAKMYEVEVGSEMIAAVDAAKEVGARVAFIDMESNLVFQRFMQEMSFEEKVKFVVSLVLGFFARKKDIEKEIKRFEMSMMTSTYMAQFAKEFPSLKKVLIDERNQYMAAIIREMGKDQPRIVVVVGDGHVKGIDRLLRPLYENRMDIIRLKELRKDTWKRLEVSGGPTSTVSFSFDTM